MTNPPSSPVCYLSEFPEWLETEPENKQTVLVFPPGNGPNHALQGTGVPGTIFLNGVEEITSHLAQTGKQVLRLEQGCWEKKD